MLYQKLRTSLAGLELRTPIILASGVAGYAIEYDKLKDIDFDMIGGIVLKGVSLEGKEGNLGPRIVDSTTGVINAIGLENPGVDKLLKEILPKIPKKTTLIANIFGDTVQEYGQVAERLNDVREIHALEVNISCPNVKRGGKLFGSDPVITREVIHAVKSSYTKRPVIVKLTPDVSDIAGIANAAVQGGADIVSLINTMPALAININVPTPGPVLGNIFGGLSGPAIKPIGLAKVRQVYQFFKEAGIQVPIIGVGGIMSWSDAVEYLAAGASAIQIGTVMFVDDGAYQKIAKGIEEYIKQRKYTSVQDIVGSWKYYPARAV